MFLKRVELTGFKSFATKTSVEFIPGITIIVGPNGCGKSNIFDAVRWVLGEQSAKSLRGSRMNDVIFAGSASYKALSYAQVTLVIDNQDRRIPLDFSEISVTRRLFSTGESEYLLNKVPCRLKDIVELFMDTGVGMEAYSIMEQGRVDQIIGAKPNERRYIFEEAAGISKYKSRKEEALRKLIRTEEDLLRVADIIEEVRKSAESLKRQASKAERYKRLLSEQNEIEKRLIILRYQFLREHSALVESQHAEVADHHASLSAKIAAINSQSEEERTQSDLLAQGLSESQGLAFNLGTDIEKCRHQISLLKERINNTDETGAKLSNELEAEKKRAEELEHSIAALKREFEESETALRETEKTYQNKKSRYEDIRQSHQTKLVELEEHKNEESICLSEKARLLNEIRYADAMREKIVAQMKEDEEALAGEISSLAELEALLNERKKTLIACESEIAALRKKTGVADRELKKCEAVFEHDRAGFQVMVMRLQDAESRLGVLQELRRNYEGFERGVKTIMKAAKSGEMDGVGEIIASCITLPERYEQAIETALGSGLQAIISLDADRVEKALYYLKEKKAGQAGFLPRDLVLFETSNGNMQSILESGGVVGLARDLVESGSGQKNLIDALLGDTVVVENLAAARRLLSEGKHARYVTLEGDCIEKNGFIMGGSDKKSGILSRERESRELVNLIATLKKSAQEMEAKLASAKKEIENRRTTLNSLTSTLHERELAQASLLKDVESAGKNCQDNLTLVRSMEEKITLHKAELVKYDETIEVNHRQIAGLEQRIEQVRKAISELITILEADKAEQSELDEEVSRLLLEQTRQQERFHALSERLAAAKSNLESSDHSIQQKMREMENLSTRKSELVASMREAENNLQSLIHEREEMEREITIRLQEKETLTLNLKKLGQEFTVLQRDFNEVQNTLHELDLKRTQYSAQMESLSQQAEEKFQKGVETICGEVGEVSGDRDQLINQLGELKDKIDRIGPINAAAIDQYQEAIQRYEFLTTQQKDLLEAKESLKKTISHIDQTTKQLFNDAFENIRVNFIETFRTLFGGGRADIIIVEDEEDKEREPGVDIVAQPPGKKLQNISLLSGGEKSLTAVALLFAIFMYKPSPFCLLDEIDAALDDANVERFKELLGTFADNTQFVIVTHNKQTMALTDTIYGVTMEEPGVSKLVSVKFENIEERLLVG
jgi:chromosome segregation protein